MTLPDLSKMAMKRYELSSIKCSNQNLINHELSIHQNAISEYLPLYQLHTPSPSSADCQLHLQNFINQPYINNDMRYLMIDTLVSCHSTLKLSTPTLFQSISIMDRISCNYIIRDYNYKLIAIVALWISSKFYDLKRRVPTLDQLTQLTQYRYDSSEICSMELILLNNLNWNIDSISTLDTCIDSILFPCLAQLGSDINNLKIWMLIIGELCMFDINLTMQYTPQDMVHAIFQIAMNINDYHQSKAMLSMATENHHDPMLLNKILRYLIGLNCDFPVSVSMKYGKNILFKTLKDYLIYCNDNELMDDFITQLITPTNTKTPTTLSSKVNHHSSYTLPMTPTTPNHIIASQIQNKKPFTDTSADSDVSFKRPRI
ncbi:hypothetical protein MOUN0_L10660 [Monosporozyma unispora]